MKYYQRNVVSQKKNGFTIATCNVNIYRDFSIIKRKNIDEEKVKQTIKDNLKIEVLLTKLSIKDDLFYFKTEDECNNFVSELNKIKKLDTKIEGIVDTYTLVSTEESLKEYKDSYTSAVKKEQERARTYTVTSRSGSSRRSYKAPMASYVYISSGYGMRNGRMHTGVDFAASSGTKIFA